MGNVPTDDVNADAVYLLRQEAIARTAERLKDLPEVSEIDRDAILTAIQEARDEREAQLGGSSCESDRPERSDGAG